MKPYFSVDVDFQWVRVSHNGRVLHSVTSPYFVPVADTLNKLSK